MRRPEPAHPTEVIDVGLQSERTYLAWQRTALAFAGVGALLLYTGLSRGPALAIPGGLGLLTGVVLLAWARPRYRLMVAAAGSGRAVADRRMVVGVATAATLLALAGFAVLLVAAGHGTA